MTQYDARDLAAKLKAQVDAAIKQDRLKPTEGMRLLAEYERGLKDHTYLSLLVGLRPSRFAWPPRDATGPA